MERAEVDFNRDVYCVMGLPIDAVDMQGAVQRVREAAFERKSCVIATPNLNFVMLAREDEAFRNSVLRSDLVLADGMPLIWVARLLGLPIRERVSGAGLFESLLKHPGPPVTIYFFGGPEGVAEAACQRVNQFAGGLRCVGHDAPGFGSVEEMSTDEHIDRINRSGAQFVIVSLGAKKGQAWIEHNRERLDAPVICHLGAVVNFAAGTVKRAPRWLQVMGAEWLWRIKEEPGLWRRYWNDGVSLVYLTLSQLLPLAALMRWHYSLRSSAAEGRLAFAEAERQTTMTLSSAWVRANLRPLRLALARAQRRRHEVVMSLAAVGHVDCAFIGLMQIAWSAFEEERGLRLMDIGPIAAQVFTGCGASFMLVRSQR